MHKFLGVVRAPFLLLTPICMLLGVVTAYISTQSINAQHLVIAFVAGLAAHISVNALNEYIDFKSGLDFNTLRTPFSGGSGTLVKYPEFAKNTLLIGLISLAITIACGIYLVLQVGWGLLPFGLLGVIIITAYTPWINQNSLLCLLAPGIAFGPIMVIGTHFSLAADITSTVIWISLVPFFLVNNLLLLNQFPDIEADRKFGRKHYPIQLGKQYSSLIFGCFLMLGYVAIILAVALGEFPVSSLLGMITLPIALIIFYRLRKDLDSIDQLVPAMGLNVLLVLSTPLFLTTGFYLGM